MLHPWASKKWYASSLELLVRFCNPLRSVSNPPTFPLSIKEFLLPHNTHLESFHRLALVLVQHWWFVCVARGTHKHRAASHRAALSLVLFDAALAERAQQGKSC